MAGAMTAYAKRADAAIVYQIDWGAKLSGRAVTASAWTIVPDEAGGISVIDDAMEGASARVRLAGGVPGHAHRATCRVLLSDGLVDRRSIDLNVEGPRC